MGTIVDTILDDSKDEANFVLEPFCGNVSDFICDDIGGFVVNEVGGLIARPVEYFFDRGITGVREDAVDFLAGTPEALVNLAGVVSCGSERTIDNAGDKVKGFFTSLLPF